MSDIPNLINHVVLVLDESSSMGKFREEFIKVVDSQLGYLAERSRGHQQETRITIYTFNTEVRNIVYDMDVLRFVDLVGSIRRFYNPSGMTALVAATTKAIQDLQRTATLYGDHSFLFYVLTDGQENASASFDKGTLPDRTYYTGSRYSYSSGYTQTATAQQIKTLSSLITTAPEEWTIAALVPDKNGEHEAKRFGFAQHNIQIWNANTAQGVVEAVETIRRTTDTYMQARSQGFKGTRGIFQLDAASLNPQTVQQALKKVPYDAYIVQADEPIASFMSRQTGKPYKVGTAFYELTKPEAIQSTKKIAVRDRRTNEVFTGPQARQLLNLPDYEVRVRPTDHPLYDIFVQSTSVNRKLVPPQTVIVPHN